MCEREGVGGDDSRWPKGWASHIPSFHDIEGWSDEDEDEDEVKRIGLTLELELKLKYVHENTIKSKL